jgi:hypothetical protein
MTLLTPLALLWLGSIPVLLWLWRISATRRRIAIPSLVPFERLLKRTPMRRTRLVINALFWLQLAACAGLALALARPLLIRRDARTILVVLDTSASMEAGLRGQSAFDRARQALLKIIEHASPADRLFIMMTAPVTPLHSQPTSDSAALIQALRTLRPSHLGGNLATTVRIGRALLASDPDETVMITDEAPPKDLTGRGVRWVPVGEPLANIAIVGVDAQGPLCTPEDARVIVTVQNFSREAASVSVIAAQHGQRIAQSGTELGPGLRRAVSLAVPEGVEGMIDIALEQPSDALSVDNRAWVAIHRTSALPVVVRFDSPALTRTISTWLQACQALRWTAESSAEGGASLVITDRGAAIGSPPAGAAAMVFLPPATPQPVLSYWMVASDHPIGSYLAPVEAIPAAVNVSATSGLSGVPVVSGLVNGRKIPIVIADEREGKRTVSLFLDPTPSAESMPVLLTFFNSLRWLLGRVDQRHTGEPLTLRGFTSGRVQVRRPDGLAEVVEIIDEAFRYDATTIAGLYRFSQGASEVAVAVNFFDPIESTLINRVSTWREVHGAPDASVSSPTGRGPTDHSARGPSLPGGQPPSYPLSRFLMMAVLGVLLLEWWRYSLKGSSTVHSPQSTVLSR